MSSDPLLQPYQLKHLTLRNRIMTTSHEPAYPEDGMPKDRYRLYHLERAKAGVALTMTAGSAAVSRDSPPVFNNILAYKDEVVPWMKRLADDCHAAGAAVMISARSVAKLTCACTTSGTVRSARSTRATHDAQVMPSTGKLSVTGIPAAKGFAGAFIAVSFPTCFTSADRDRASNHGKVKDKFQKKHSCQPLTLP